MHVPGPSLATRNADVSHGTDLSSPMPFSSSRGWLRKLPACSRAAQQRHDLSAQRRVAAAGRVHRGATPLLRLGFQREKEDLVGTGVPVGHVATS
jgi:hypothetical protein